MLTEIVSLQKQEQGQGRLLGVKKVVLQELAAAELAAACWRGHLEGGVEGQGGLQVLVAAAALLRMLRSRDLGQMFLQGLAAAVLAAAG